MSLVGFRSSNHPQQVGKRGATDRDNLGTDPALYAKLNERFHFTLDVAASRDNAKTPAYFALDRQNGLTVPWFGRVWCNPPYSQLGEWVVKAWGEWTNWGVPRKGNTAVVDLIVMLVPANRTEQAWWQDFVEPRRDRDGSPLRVEFLRGRNGSCCLALSRSGRMSVRRLVVVF